MNHPSDRSWLSYVIAAKDLIGKAIRKEIANMPVELRQKALTLRADTVQPWVEIARTHPEAEDLAELHDLYVVVEGVIVRASARGKPINLKLAKRRDVNL